MTYVDSIHSDPAIAPRQWVPAWPNNPQPQYQSPYQSPYPSTISYHQDIQPTLSPATIWQQPSTYFPTDREHHAPSTLPAFPERYAHQGSAYEPRPAPAPNQLHWIQHEFPKRKRDDSHHGDHGMTEKRMSTQHGYGQAQYPHMYQRPPTEMAQQGPPQLPGAAQYLQRLDMQKGPALSSLPVPTPNDSSSRANIAQPAGHSSSTSNRVANTTYGPSFDRNQVSSQQPVRTSGPLLGTQHAPLELSPSPEPKKKRSKPANKPQTARLSPRHAEKPARPMNYDGFSRQELSKILAESTDVKPQKTRYYAVVIGHERGVYYDWPSAEKQVRGYVGAKHKKFKTEREAIDYCTEHWGPTPIDMKPAERPFDSGYRSNEIKYEPLPSSSQMKHSLDLNRNFVPLGEGPVDDGPQLVPEQQHVVDLILQGHNVFYTGSAGCGKSTILKAFVKRLQQQGKRVKIVAPTNLAALNIGGQTTWSFAGWTPDSMRTRIDKLMEKSRGDKSFKKFDETDVLVIDEVSMIENLMFERLNMILKASRGQKYGGGAFGGVQLVVTGDVSLFMSKSVFMANQHSSISLPPSSHSVTACAAGN